MKIARNHAELTQHIHALKSQGKRIGFVPTMGALHAGHLSLVTLAQENCDAVVASIFVNPTQFGPSEDFARYPRQPEADVALLESVGAHALYLPQVADIYPNGAHIDVHVPPKLTHTLCGLSRPGHFDGVATVVRRLFDQVQPDVAVFGEKDYQQLQVIRWLVQDYRLAIEIIGAPIAREADGLAMSSRNAYLSNTQRAIAPKLYAVMREVVDRIQNQESSDKNILHDAKAQLTTQGFIVDYLEFQEGRLFAAVFLGHVRLIDNLCISS